MPTQITQFPPAPQHTDSPAVFSTKGDNFIAAFPQFVIEANQLAADLNVAMNSAYLGNTATSTTSVTIGTGTKNFTVETNKNFVTGMTIKATFDANNYIIGTVSAYNSSTGAISIIVNTTAGSGTYAQWYFSPSVIYNPVMQKFYLTSNAALDYTVSGKLIEVSGSITISFGTNATLGNGWYIFMRNVGVRDVTLDPFGTELIDGLTTVVLKPGSTCIVYSNGTALQVLPLFNADIPDKGFKNKVLITSTSTFNIPTGVTRIRAYAVGAGATGHVTNGSGGGGGLAWGDIEVTTASRTLSITINSSTTTIAYNASTHYTANAASGVTGGTATISGSVFNGGASTGGAGGGVGGASSGTIFGTGVAGTSSGTGSGSGWGGNGVNHGGGLGGTGNGQGLGALSGATGTSGQGRLFGGEFTDPLLYPMTAGGNLNMSTTYFGAVVDGVGGISMSSSSANITAQAGGFGAGGGSATVTSGTFTATAGNGGFGGGGGGATAQTGGTANAGVGGYGGGGGKASGGSTNNQGVGGAGAVIILY